MTIEEEEDKRCRSDEDLERMAAVLKVVSSLEEARVISLDYCELSIDSKSAQNALVSSLSPEIREKIRFREPLAAP
jgi:hypothetical protein